MSTYWYLACDDCKRYAALGASGSSGVVAGLAGDDWLRPFAVAHRGHVLRCVSEHDEKLSAYEDAETTPTAREQAFRWPSNETMRSLVPPHISNIDEAIAFINGPDGHPDLTASKSAPDTILCVPSRASDPGATVIGDGEHHEDATEERAAGEGAQRNRRD